MWAKQPQPTRNAGPSALMHHHRSWRSQPRPTTFSSRAGTSPASGRARRPTPASANSPSSAASSSTTCGHWEEARDHIGDNAEFLHPGIGQDREACSQPLFPARQAHHPPNSKVSTGQQGRARRQVGGGQTGDLTQLQPHLLVLLQAGRLALPALPRLWLLQRQQQQQAAPPRVS